MPPTSLAAVAHTECLLMQMETKSQIEEMQRKLKELDTEWKTKQTVLRLFSDGNGPGQMVGMDTIKKEMQQRD